MNLVQITRRRGQVRVPVKSGEPLIELHLEPNERVIDFKLVDLQEFTLTDRATHDWAWMVTIETRL